MMAGATQSNKNTKISVSMTIALVTTALTVCSPASAALEPTPAAPTPMAEEVIQRLLEANRQGETAAARLLGDAYRTGHGVQKNLNTAFDYYTTAAKQGDRDAQLRIGESYHRGAGTDSNQISAWIWLTLSAEDESPVKEQALTLRESVGALLTTQQKQRAGLLLDSIRTIVNR